MVVAETHLAGPGLATARVTARAPAGEVLVTTATRRHLTGSGIQLAKGVEVVILNPFRTKMKLYAVTSLEPVPGRTHARTSPDVGRVERISDPPEADVTDLLYGFGEVTMVFAPRNVLEEIRANRHALSTCETWGDLRRRISQTRWAELRADLLAAIQMRSSPLMSPSGIVSTSNPNVDARQLRCAPRTRSRVERRPRPHTA